MKPQLFDQVYRVKSYDARNGAHNVLDQDGAERKVDLMIGGGFEGVDPESLVGRKFKSRVEFPHVSLTLDVEEIK